MVEDGIAFLIRDGETSRFNDQRKRRRMTADASCPRCGAVQETVVHALRECPDSIATWRQWAPPRVLNRWRDSTLQNWIEQNLKSRERVPVLDLHWNVVFAILCWHLWTGRNRFIFRQEHDWLETTGAGSGQNQRRRVCSRSTWESSSRRSC